MTGKNSREEKKLRKSLCIDELKAIEGVARLVVRKSKDTLIFIDNPEVYKSPCSDTYLIFGEARIETMPGGQKRSTEVDHQLPATTHKIETTVEEEEEDEGEQVGPAT